MLFFYYTNRPLAAILFPFLYGAIVYVLLSGLTPIVVLVQLVSLNILFLTISRVSSFYMLYELCRAVLITRVMWPIKSDRKNVTSQHGTTRVKMIVLLQPQGFRDAPSGNKSGVVCFIKETDAFGSNLGCVPLGCFLFRPVIQDLSGS